MTDSFFSVCAYFQPPSGKDQNWPIFRFPESELHGGKINTQVFSKTLGVLISRIGAYNRKKRLNHVFFQNNSVDVISRIGACYRKQITPCFSQNVQHQVHVISRIGWWRRRLDSFFTFKGDRFLFHILRRWTPFSYSTEIESNSLMV